MAKRILCTRYMSECLRNLEQREKMARVNAWDRGEDNECRNLQAFFYMFSVIQAHVSGLYTHRAN